jgi:NADH:ubiquinone oxidoreductase subunit B-like Fe-S oxidoreductase
VEVYGPGCPPNTDGLIYGILQLREKVERDRKRMGRRLPPGVTAEPPPVEGETEPATKAS